MKRDKLGLARIVFFTDAVFAIAITLLALNLRLPQSVHSSGLAHNLQDLIPQYQSYATSFCVIGLYWISHHHYFRFIRRYNYTFVGINIALLMGIAFLPFATSVLDDYSNQRSAVVFYALCMATTGFLKTLLWYYASHQFRLVSRFTSPQRIQRLTWRAMIPPVVFTLSIGLALLNVDLAKLS
ncbi:MAG TPA: TMEM175 family protein [Leptolyngbyaceae cyanobacterium]